jgi:hypothetical protein
VNEEHSLDNADTPVFALRILVTPSRVGAAFFVNADVTAKEELAANERAALNTPGFLPL